MTDEVSGCRRERQLSAAHTPVTNLPRGGRFVTHVVAPKPGHDSLFLNARTTPRAASMRELPRWAPGVVIVTTFGARALVRRTPSRTTPKFVATGDASLPEVRPGSGVGFAEV